MKTLPQHQGAVAARPEGWRGLGAWAGPEMSWPHGIPERRCSGFSRSCPPNWPPFCAMHLQTCRATGNVRGTRAEKAAAGHFAGPTHPRCDSKIFTGCAASQQAGFVTRAFTVLPCVI